MALERPCGNSGAREGQQEAVMRVKQKEDKKKSQTMEANHTRKLERNAKRELRNNEQLFLSFPSWNMEHAEQSRLTLAAASNVVYR